MSTIQGDDYPCLRKSLVAAAGKFPWICRPCLGNLISGHECLDEVELCSDFEKNFEVYPGVLHLRSIDPRLPIKGSVDRI